jgi:hypothetical protein
MNEFRVKRLYRVIKIRVCVAIPQKGDTINMNNVTLLEIEKRVFQPKTS